MPGLPTLKPVEFVRKKHQQRTGTNKINTDHESTRNIHVINTIMAVLELC
jgi:hypothetical protein